MTKNYGIIDESGNVAKTYSEALEYIVSLISVLYKYRL